MKRFARYMAVLVATMVATACTMIDFNEFEDPVVSSDPNDVVSVTARTTHYVDCAVGTRSKKVGDEGKVTSMALAIFPVEGNTLGNCVYYKYNATGSMLFVIERASQFTEKKPYAMYFFANMQGSGIPEEDDKGVGKAFSYFTNLTYTVTGGGSFESVPDNGFPLVGSLGDTVNEGADNQVFILSPGNNALPTVDDKPSDNLEIPMKSMFAKISFTIISKPDQEVEDHAAPRFDLNNYTINNVSNTLHFFAADNKDNNSAGDVVQSGERVFTNNYAQGATSATFDFYIPERLVTPNAFTYPSGMSDVELEKYKQRFKPLLVDGKNATYVTIDGNYTDHQKHVYNIKYDIYLGANNYNDFNVLRNTHYSNTLTIKGIQASNDHSANYDPNDPNDNYNDTPVSIDHRVTINRDASPLVVGLKRETLLDAHYEVRPLRLHLSGGPDPDKLTSAVVTVTLSDYNDENGNRWIGMERNDGGSETYTHLASGKRKYFTVNLMEELTSNTLTIDNPSHGGNKTIWIYVDENTDTEQREAKLTIKYDYTYKDDFGNEREESSESVFTIVQHGLYAVTYEGRTYHIERFEEYLYNYDTEDLFGKTDQNGMPWGLEGVQLSRAHKSFDLTTEDNDDWKNFVNNTLLPTYDFYIRKHDAFAENTGGKVYDYAGQLFTDSLYYKTRGKEKKIRNNLTMEEKASGAVEYCYNRNKRNATGEIAKVEWYLPSTDEMEEIIEGGYGTFKEFQDNYYWTSQPAYIRDIFYYQYSTGILFWKETTISAITMYIDNTEYARATKAVYNGNEDYSFAPSGLKKQPDGFVSRAESGYEAIEDCFYEMHRWKEGDYDIVTYYDSEVNTNSNPPKTKGSRSGDERYTDSKNNDKKVYVHLGHLDDLMEDGYKHRSESHRVRCAYKKKAN